MRKAQPRKRTRTSNPEPADPSNAQRGSLLADWPPDGPHDRLPASWARQTATAGKERSGRSKILLAAEPSADLRDRLIAEIELLMSTNEAADWAHKSLPAKNALITEHADLVEAAFRDKLATIEASTGIEPTDEPSDRWEAATGEVALTGNELFLSPVENPSVRPTALQADCRPPPRRRQGDSPARQGALQVRRDAALRDLRPDACGSPSPSVRSASRVGAQGQRRIHGPRLPAPSPRTASLW